MLGLKVCGSALPRFSSLLLSARTKLFLQFDALKKTHCKNNCATIIYIFLMKNLVQLQRVSIIEASSVPIRRMSEEVAAQAGRSAG